MITRAFAESVVEEAALDRLAGRSYGIADGPDIAPGEPGAERRDFGQVVLEGASGGPCPRSSPSTRCS